MEIELTSRSKSQIGEYTILIEAHKRNYIVSKPVSGDARYDYIFHTPDNKLFRVQIKYLSRRKGESKEILELLIVRKNKKNSKAYLNSEIDLLLIYCPFVDKILCFPPKLFHEKKRILINLRDEKSPNHYSKYLWN